MNTAKLESLFELYSFFATIEGPDCELTNKLKQDMDAELHKINAALKA